MTAAEVIRPDWGTYKAAEMQDLETGSEWAQRVRAIYGESVGSIIAVGTLLNEMKETLGHGQFQAALQSHHMPFRPRVAQKYMRIARHPTLANASNWTRLPASWTTLYTLSGIDAKKLAGFRLHPAMTGEDADRIAGKVRSEKAAEDQKSQPDALTRMLRVQSRRIKKCTDEEREWILIQLEWAIDEIERHRVDPHAGPHPATEPGSLYWMAYGSDRAFEQALEVSKAQGDLSRRNVTRNLVQCQEALNEKCAQESGIRKDVGA